MVVESMNDQEFALEVVRDYFDEMRGYVQGAVVKKGRIKKRHASNYTSKRRNQWLIIYSESRGQCGLHIKRPQPKAWFTWYSLVFSYNTITLFGFNKHVAERISQRYHPELTPSEALKEMLLKTPAIIQNEVGDSFYTRVNGGICIGSVYGKRIPINIGNSMPLEVCLRDTSTFLSDDLLYDDQKKVSNESISRAIETLGKQYLSYHDFKR